jgi:hypothetical protein
MILFSPSQDGSGVVAIGTTRIGFAAGITPADMLAMHEALKAAQPTAPTPIAVAVTVPSLASLAGVVNQIAAYLPQLQSAVAKIPGAAAIPPAPAVAPVTAT